MTVRFPFFLLVPLFLVGCAWIVPSTVAHLQALDPIAANPAEVEVAVILPPGLALAPGSAELKLAVISGAKTLDQSFKLWADVEPVSDPSLPKHSTANLLRLSPNDVVRMQAIQKQIAEWKVEDDGTKGSISVGLGGCGVGEGPEKDARASVLIRTKANTPFLPLVRDASVRDLIGPTLFDAIKPCEPAK